MRCHIIFISEISIYVQLNQVVLKTTRDIAYYTLKLGKKVSINANFKKNKQMTECHREEIMEYFELCILTVTTIIVIKQYFQNIAYFCKKKPFIFSEFIEGKNKKLLLTSYLSRFPKNWGN